MRNLSDILFLFGLFILAASVGAPIIGLEITYTGALLIGAIFIVCCLLSGIFNKGDQLHFLLPSIIVSGSLLIFLSIFFAGSTLQILVLALEIGLIIKTVFSFFFTPPEVNQ